MFHKHLEQNFEFLRQHFYTQLKKNILLRSQIFSVPLATVSVNNVMFCSRRVAVIQQCNETPPLPTVIFFSLSRLLSYFFLYVMMVGFPWNVVMSLAEGVCQQCCGSTPTGL